ncbi:hypothetical protein LAV84_26185 [Rhizobium sp. VS19-DR104.2]|uniref:hypothetical protein n=1 Tax=unclassified Rhizobium TaxID=2613769 RepID=UPI001C5A689C|nr:MULTISPECIES: hypothetical protein [unclassified Rhizobium]MBZ5763081.1 hypothetical protein [Rhizobium sp. VS19-DR96]MBZ5768957.1 hypothetical protein [Rhizobium sp. VS19-DR129.2]MBZ5776575.1 hypothetical protein [Rhizobium sp. VS19-DRK62.2]MBZ5787686.1 hypothetical protein [Rhizobium sp. VS19-DR121]MBZ5805059.1 hypothetical protein [Rhizobium sp. VS19-DR181]
MTVTLDGNAILMTGVCGVDEVETLMNFLEEQPETTVDLAGATAIHTAHWQALMVFRPKIIGTPASSSTVDRVLSSLFVYYEGMKS